MSMYDVLLMKIVELAIGSDDVDEIAKSLVKAFIVIMAPLDQEEADGRIEWVIKNLRENQPKAHEEFLKWTEKRKAQRQEEEDDDIKEPTEMPLDIQAKTNELLRRFAS